MPDFRSDLYNQYVSKFKKEDSQLHGKGLQAYWDWCSYKYLPFLKELKAADNILELGCGPGYLLEFLKNSGFINVRGIDISEEQLQIARNKGLGVKKADAIDYLQQNKEFFQAIIAIDFIEHFTKEEALRLSQLLYNSLETNGILIIQTPNGQGLFSNQVIYGDLTHLTIFTPESLKQLLSLSGFSDFRFQETGPVGKNLYGKIRLVLWKVIKKIVSGIRKIETGKSQDIWTENFICYCRKL
ncbi:MAG: class I SAM-dependent methyltransferase [Thermodesulfobacteriota bacterium]